MSFYKENEQNSILLLFSCPGKKEKEKGCPCAGKTGDNLKILLENLNHTNPNEFPKERAHYYINNAWNKVEYKGATGITEASVSDITGKHNLKRIASEISHVKKIICFGDRAKLVIEELIHGNSLKSSIPVYLSPHLGFQSINRRIKTDIDGNPLRKGGKCNTDKRLAVIARDVLNSRLQ